jgi:hypothetical protein
VELSGFLDCLQGNNSEVEMKIWHHVFRAVSGLMVMLSVAKASDGSDRLLVSHNRFWRLSEEDWSLREVTDEFSTIVGTRRVLAVDCRVHPRSREFGDIGIEVAQSPYNEILVLDSGRLEVNQRFVGARPGFRLSEGYVGLFKINPETIETAFYIVKLYGREERMVVTGGFFEPYPAVASPRFFYVFRSSDNRTLRVDVRTNVVDEPSFLNRRVVLAVWENDERFLIEDRVTKEKVVLDSSGKIMCSLKIDRPHAAVEFSNNGNYVYVSIARVENSAEIYDFCAYELVSGKLTIIRRNFSVGRGQVSRGGFDPE